MTGLQKGSRDVVSSIAKVVSPKQLESKNLRGTIDSGVDKNLDILKSNSYYYHNFFNEYVDSIINLKLKEFIKFLKKIYKDKFYKLAYLKDIIELEKFDYTLKNFILEKANLDRKKCFDFFYSNMGKIMEDLHLLPKKYIMFY